MMDDLADRIAALSAPDRAVDVAIFRAIGAPVPFQFASKMVALTFDEAEQCYFAPIGDMRVRYEPPAYTGSIDAAMTLAPKGCDMMFAVIDGKSYAGLGAERGPADVEAATLPLALCAAALRMTPRQRDHP